MLFPDDLFSQLLAASPQRLAKQELDLVLLVASERRAMIANDIESMLNARRRFLQFETVTGCYNN